MTGATRVSGRGARVGVVLAALAGPIVVAVTTHAYGLNLSPDTLTYLRGADVLAADGVRGVVSFPTALYPPGLSAVLAPAAAAGAELAAARWLNIGLAAVGALGVGLLLARHVRPVLAIIAAAAVGVGYPMAHIGSWLSSEPLYVALTLAHLGLLAHLVGARRPGAVAAGAGLVAGLTVLVRYSGVAVIPIGVLAVVLLVPRGRRWRRLASYLLPVGLVAGSWLLRNVLIAGDPTGDRASNERGLLDVVADGGGTVALWFAPPGVSEVRGAVAGAGLVVVVTAAAVVAVLGRPRHGTEPDRFRPALAALLVGYVATSTVALTVMVSATNTDRMSDRLLAHLWPALVALLVVAVDLALDRASRATTVLVAVSVVALALSTVRTLDAVADGEWTGAGFNGPRWQSDEVRTLVAATPPDSSMISNEPYGLTVVSAREVFESPRYTEYASTKPPDESVDTLAAIATARPSYLVWVVVDEPVDDDHLSPPELAQHVTLEPVASTSAGQVYRVLPPGTPPGDR